ncbi:MAG TPA: 50S ribosomal protein L22 [Candidatus Hydrogenedentes bacterium]|nr:50S ribosomal protein L22 [Candidatus Hydrogenedentota bacterium]HQH54222.1 50S ribosomal protein L22 [Candidatus Hydrogenedentota bacterium]HQM49943.1 50S ribosomal protein L22 [Candidatus Hydrogenedentota bacterium]
MAEAIARARFVRMAPRKIRLVADMIRGKKVEEARDTLAFTVKGAAPLLAKLLDSAVANAESKAAEKRQRVDTDAMVVTKVLVDGGPSMKRLYFMPRGRAGRVRKRMSHIELVISDS